MSISFSGPVPGDTLSRTCERQDALTSMGAVMAAEWEWFVWETVTAARDSLTGRVLLAADPWHTNEDWDDCVNALLPPAAAMGGVMHEHEHDIWLWDVSR